MDERRNKRIDEADGGQDNSSRIDGQRPVKILENNGPAPSRRFQCIYKLA
jgi:hypothetical protein